MPAYKDEKTGKWFAKFYYTNWQGIKKQKWKRGFATKKEALGFERDFLEQQSANPDMTFQNLYEIYMEDMAARLKQSTLLTKKTVLQTHILLCYPVFHKETEVCIIFSIAFAINLNPSGPFSIFRGFGIGQLK